ncbi:MAG TPA: hypothetical protein VL025_03090 [Thermoanaerobaculia bacterium]|nr:hypothetical protein [Thermoanaerobaculia bacterium]
MSTRKILTGALMTAFLGAVAGPATAGEIGVFGSYWETSDADEAIGFGTKLRFGVVELRGTYFQDATADLADGSNLEVRAIPLEVGVAFKFAQDAVVSPYLGGGGGYYLLDTSEFDVDDEVGWYAVAGADFGRQSSGMAFNVEAIYRSMEATVREDADGLPGDLDEEVDLDLGGVGLNAGVVFRF